MRRAKPSTRKGSIITLVAVLSPVLLGLGAFAIDVGHIAFTRTKLQAGADAAALAAVMELPGEQATLNAVASQFAAFNLPGANLQVTAQGGRWDEDALSFTAGNLPSSNAVRATVSLQGTGLFFGRLFGISSADVSVSAVATKPSPGTRFLIDDEMIDTDVPAIQSLATSTGRSVDSLLRARGFNQGKQYGDNNWTWEDNFLDLPPGVTLNLPTGQGTSYSSNDAGMFDIDHPEFPFTDDAAYMQFLKYSETGNDPSKWGTDTTSIRNQLDPLQGVAPVTDGSTFDSFVNPDFTHVSPVTFSDCSTLNMSAGVPQINAKGLRRGLIAFKIIAVGNDIDGGGSVLPQLVVEIVDPATIDPDDLKPAGLASTTFRLVQ